MSYAFLQEYWWFIVSLLGGLLVFLLFVQGANSLIFSLGGDESERTLIVNSTGRKWEFTFTTLVTFGGAFFASFPLFYSTSFGGAYWVWMLILVSFVLQATAYEYQSKPGNTLGRTTYRRFLVLNGLLGPLLLGAAVATLFTGGAFVVNKGAMDGAQLSPVISQWANAWHGLDALFEPWNWVLGLAVLFLARTLGALYLLNNIEEPSLHERLRRAVRFNAVPFLLLFVAFAGYLLTKDGAAYDAASGSFSIEPLKYLHNFAACPAAAALLLTGTAFVLHGLYITLFGKSRRGIWPAGAGTVLAVTALLLSAGLNNTAFYPSTADLQSSLALANSCSSEFTLRTMAYVSLLIPFVLAYIAYAWHAIDKKGLTKRELEHDEHKY